MTWGDAREGRKDWGGRYAPLNHAPGNSHDVLAARTAKIDWATENYLSLGTVLSGQDNLSRQKSTSVCSVLYLLRRTVPSFGKDRLTLQIHPLRQVEPTRQSWRSGENQVRVEVAQGDLKFQGLPDCLTVCWKGQELFHTAGFDAGGATGAASRSDFKRPFLIEALEGIVTKLTIHGETERAKGGAVRWQSTYWLFPEGRRLCRSGRIQSHRTGPISRRSSEAKHLCAPTRRRRFHIRARAELGSAVVSAPGRRSWFSRPSINFSPCR